MFTITLPDGSRECSAYPQVFIGCGTGFRATALQQVGGLPDDFFMQAEEYDLSLRLLDAGWNVQTFNDLHVSHLKTPGARYNERVMQLDVRNNFMLITRYFPEDWVVPFAMDWMRRYYVIASGKGQTQAYLKGLVQGMARSIGANHRRPVSESTFQSFTRLRQIEDRLGNAQRTYGLRKVLFVDLGKNILPYWLAARRCGMEVIAIADPKIGAGKRYRGIPIVNDPIAAQLTFDAAIISNLSPVHAARRAELWRTMTARPVIDLFETEGAPAVGV